MRVINFLLNAVFAVILTLAGVAFGGLDAIWSLGRTENAAPLIAQLAPPPQMQTSPRADPSPPAAPGEQQAAHSEADPPAELEAQQPPEAPALQPASALPSPPGEAPASVAPFPAVISYEPAKADPATVALPAPLKAPAPAVIPKQAAAKDLFGAVKEPASLATRSIGFYAHGCLAGGKPLPVNGPAWQVMRLSRNRNWGHPSLIRYIERFATDAKEKDGWPGLLVGDLSMPRGGPMPFGHTSHQVGLDVDIWYKPEPDRELTPEERENIKMESFLSDPGHVNPRVWKAEYEPLLRRAVSYPEVARIFVNPAIKKWLCDNSKGDRTFLQKITPIMGHDDHFHVRLVCPASDAGCQNQPAVKADEGCGKGLDKWIEALMKLKPSAPVAAAPPKPLGKIMAWKKKVAGKKKPLTMAQLPPECELVLKARPVSAPAKAAVR